MATKPAPPTRKRIQKKSAATGESAMAVVSGQELKRESKDSTAMAVIAKISEQNKCPITQQLVVDPVIADDGHVYERKAIVKWLARKKSSPKTNKPMRAHLVPAVVARQTVGELVEQGMIDAEASFSFFLERGRVRVARAAAFHSQGPDLDGATLDFQRALECASALEQRKTVEFQLKAMAWMKEGASLVAEAQTLGQQSRSDDVQAWIVQLGDAVRSVMAGPSRRAHRLTEWRQLPQGTQVRVIDDVHELRGLCERPAPGAEDSVRWVEEMADWAGAPCVVDSMGVETHKNYTLRREALPSGQTFSFPYNALILMGSS